MMYGNREAYESFRGIKVYPRGVGTGTMIQTWLELGGNWIVVLWVDDTLSNEWEFRNVRAAMAKVQALREEHA